MQYRGSSADRERAHALAERNGRPAGRHADAGHGRRQP
ncbi:DUF2934 domain-containing protein [Acinetobacter baumannii]